MKLMKILKPKNKLKEFDSKKIQTFIWVYTGAAIFIIGGLSITLLLVEMEDILKPYLAMLGVIGWIILFIIYKDLERFLKKKQEEELQN